MTLVEITAIPCPFFNARNKSMITINIIDLLTPNAVINIDSYGSAEDCIALLKSSLLQDTLSSLALWVA